MSSEPWKSQPVDGDRISTLKTKDSWVAFGRVEASQPALVDTLYETRAERGGGASKSPMSRV